jgi:prolyl 4-hydroxylase
MLEVYSHDGVAHNVTMAPGDLVLYESHSVIHGRPFPLKGKFFANIFVHFEPLNVPTTVSTKPYDKIDFPPYLIPGSSWEPEWRSSFPNGWQLLNNIMVLVERNDLRTLQYVRKLHEDKLWEHDGTAAEWRPIHEAARQGYTQILKFLIEDVGQDVNAVCWVGSGMTPLAIVHQYVGAESEAAKYLESVGGVLQADVASEEVEEDIAEEL